MRRHPHVLSGCPKDKRRKSVYLLPLAFFARRCLFTLRKIAFHALAFFGTPALHGLEVNKDWAPLPMCLK